MAYTLTQEDIDKLYEMGFNMNAVANVNPVPQAASLCLFGLGLAGLGLTQRQRRTA